MEHLGGGKHFLHFCRCRQTFVLISVVVEVLVEGGGGAIDVERVISCLKVHVDVRSLSDLGVSNVWAGAFGMESQRCADTQV